MFRRHPALAVLLLAVVLVLAFQGTRGLWDPDEGRFTNVALQMLERSDGISLYRHHETLHFTKPPVTYWAIAGSVWALGWNEWAVRLPNVLAFLGVVALLLRIGRHVAPQRPWLPALVYATLPFPLLASHLVTTDTPLAFATTLALACYVIARFENKPWAVTAMWAAFGLAFLTKGPPGLLGLLPISLFQWRHPGGPKLLTLRGLLAFVVVALPWYLVVIRRHEGLLAYFIGHEVVARVATDAHNRHGEWWGGFYVYLPTLLLGALPWWPWALGAGKRIGLRWSSAAPITHLLLLWLGSILLVFLLARSRLPPYVLPLFAPLALLIAGALDSVRFTRIRIAAVAAMAVFVLGIKATAAYLPEIAAALPNKTAARLPLHKNAVVWAEGLRQRLSFAPTEVVFVDDMARYGLHLYLRAEIAKVAIEGDMARKPLSDAPFDDLLAQELRESNVEQRVYVMKADTAARFETEAQAAGWTPRALEPFRDRVFYVLTRRDSAAAP